MNQRNASLRSSGFTLVEILIVVVILGVLAAMVVPQFTSAAAETRDNSIKMNLNRVRQQLEVYHEHHDGKYPTLVDFADQLTGVTDVEGNQVPADTKGSFGPYIREMPINANSKGIVVGNGAVGDSDWFYNETNGAFHANDSILTRSY